MKHLAATELERLESLIAIVADTHDVDESVHRTRTGIKRLRAYLRLARRSIGTSTYRTENAALRDTGRLLAPARDAFVVIETARDLGSDRAVIEALVADHAAMMAGFERTTRTEVLDRLGAIVTRWRHLMWHAPGPKSIGAGLERTYRRGLVGFETVASAPSDRAFHGWRRRVKYLRYQLESIHAPAASIDPFRTLGDDLGHEHDLTVLVAVAADRPDDVHFADTARRSVPRRERLRSEAVALGGELFSDQPESFRHRIQSIVGPR